MNKVLEYLKEKGIEFKDGNEKFYFSLMCFANPEDVLENARYLDEKGYLVPKKSYCKLCRILSSEPLVLKNAIESYENDNGKLTSFRNIDICPNGQTLEEFKENNISSGMGMAA